MSAGSVKDIRRRVKSIKNTRQITKAMELVASSKLKKARENAENALAYFEAFQETMDNIAAQNQGMKSVYIQGRPKPDRVCRCVVAGDRGLAGGYNINLFRKVREENDGGECVILPMGKKAEEQFEKEYEFLTRAYTSVSAMTSADCIHAGKMLAEQYRDGVFDRLMVTYTRFVNVLTQEPETLQILPLAARTRSDGGKKTDILYEPSAETVFEHIIPDYIGGILYYAVTQSYASELCSRRNAMDTATKNADEMIDDLTLQYNRARQSAITQEITEIAAGANAGGSE